MKAKPTVTYVVQYKRHIYDWNDLTVLVDLRDFEDKKAAFFEAKYAHKVHPSYDFRVVQRTDKIVLTLSHQ